MKIDTEQLTQAMESYDIENKTSVQLSDSFKMAQCQTEHYKPTSIEHKLLTKFKAKVLKQIRRLSSYDDSSPKFTSEME